MSLSFVTSSEPLEPHVARIEAPSRITGLPRIEVPLGGAASPAGSLKNLRELDSTLVCSFGSGLTTDSIQAFAGALEAASHERPKFLIFCFEAGSAEASCVGMFTNLVHASANLILHSSTVTIAWVRGRISGAELEFALSCSMLAAEPDASFQMSPHGTTYAFLARKIGIAKAEALIFNQEVLTADDMRKLLLLRHVSGRNDVETEVCGFLKGALRRHNSLASLYKAQRLVMPVTQQLIAEAHAG